jgi:hypothetical protein
MSLHTLPTLWTDLAFPEPLHPTPSKGENESVWWESLIDKVLQEKAEGIEGELR